MSTSKFFAVIAGAGTGTGNTSTPELCPGRAVALRFAKAYPVVVLARTPKSYQDTVTEINNSGGKAVGISADVSNVKSLDTAFESIAKELPGLKLAAAMYNVSAGFAIKPFLETKVEDFDASMDGNARGFFVFAQKTMPLLLDAVATSLHPPTMLITGATAAVRGGAKFSGMAAGMFARRALGQSLAREFGPQGVHVVHAIIDGGIDVPRTEGYTFNDGVEDGKLSPVAVS
jgi:NAD(P)-dependent dehydrogenase (short-subunit alcohol dehydrogenase family)